MRTAQKYQVILENVEGNVVLSVGTFTKSINSQNQFLNADGTVSDNSEGKLANLDLAINQSNSVSYVYVDNGGNIVGDYELDLRTIFLPLSRGYGNTKAFHIALSEDGELLKRMEDIVNLTNGVSYQNLDQKIEEFIYRWTKVENINPNDKRGEFSAKKLSALEQIRGEKYTDTTGSHDVSSWQVNMVQSAWDNLFNEVKAKILIQGTFKDLFILEDGGDSIFYDFAADKINFTDLTKPQFLDNIQDQYNQISNPVDKFYFIYQTQKLLPVLINKISDVTDLQIIKSELKLIIPNQVDNIFKGTDENDDGVQSPIIGGSGQSDLIIGNKGNDNLSGS